MNNAYANNKSKEVVYSSEYLYLLLDPNCGLIYTFVFKTLPASESITYDIGILMIVLFTYKHGHAPVM